MNSDITPPPIPAPTTAVLPDILPAPLPMGEEVDTMDTAWVALPERSLSSSAAARFVPVPDMRTAKWWKRNLKRSLIVIIILLLLSGTVWGLNTFLKPGPEVTIPVVEAPAGLDEPFYGGAQNPGMLTIRRELVVTNNATFEKSVTVQDGLDVGGNLNVAGNGVFGGPVTAAGFYGDGSNLTGITVSSCSDCVALQGTPTAPQTGNIHISGSVTADNFNGGRFYGDGSGLTNLPGLKGNFVSLQDESPGTQQAGHLNISGNGIFGSDLAVGGSLAITGATVLDGSLSVTGSTALAGLSAAATALESLSVSGTTILDVLTAGTTSLDSLSVTNGGSFGGDLTVVSINTRPIGNASGDIPVSNGTVNTNLNADLLDGLDSTDFQAAGSYVNLQSATPGTAQTGNINVTGAIIAGSFSGDGANLTSLNASNISSGTLNDARLSANVALLGAANTFTALNTFSAAGTALSVTNDATIGGTLAVTGTVTGGTYNGQTISSSANFTGTLTAASTIQGSSFTSTAATGTAPLSVASTTKVTNLNSDLLDGLDSTAFAAASGSASYIQNGTTLQSSANFNIQSAAASSVGGIIRGAASQTADLLQLQNSAGTVLANVDSVGNLYGAGMYINRRFDQGGPSGGIYFINGAGTAYVRPILFDHNAASLSLGNSVANVNIFSPRSTFNYQIGDGLTASVAGGGPTFEVVRLNYGYASRLSVNRAIDVGFIIKGATGQTADLQQWQNSAGTVLARVDASGNGFFNNGAGGTGAAFVQGGNSFGTIASLGTNDAFDLQLETGGTPKLTIQNSTGNVGIGTSAPGTRLEVNANADISTTGTSYNNAQLRIRGTATTAMLALGYDTTNDKSVIQSVQAGVAFKELAINPFGGNVSIGGATSIAALGNGAAILSIRDYSGNAATSAPRILFNAGGTDIGNIKSNYNSGIFRLDLGATSTAQHLSILNNGNVGIGIISPGAQLQVNAGAAGTIGQIIKGASAQTADLLQAQDSTGAILAKIDAGGNLTVKNATVQGTLTVTGDVTFSGNVISYSNNVRGINQAITLGSNTLAVTFGTAYPDATYAVTCTPNYDTTCFVTNKTTAGFTLNFGTAAPASAIADWFVAH